MQIGCGADMFLRTLDGSEIKYSMTLGFRTTNNVTEYSALLAGLRLAKECLARNLIVYSDSRLVVNQVRGILSPREENGKVDRLARAAATEDFEQYAREMREVLKIPSIDVPESEIMQIVNAEIWITPYIRYLSDGTLSENLDETKLVKKIVGWYTMMDGKLY
ncbi:hypothetical protein Nepgr_023395 [Nepenthes gracilis]|uniref:RNase H type-1 domain-containing protein n=1 Tax=Nepenthes gracilis TaxID=150966 RepID=A0AAD3XXU6_NEPGR|nr:hypothetical protein Nepgr_023395 [Nepenthes gracilis]